MKTTSSGSETFALGTVLVVAYVAAAVIGFQVAFVAEQVTTVWAPTGLAQAALLLWGRRLWPAVWIGAFAVNASTHAPLWTAVLIASGNTLEAYLTAWLLTAIVRFDPALRRARDCVAFILVAACLSPLVSATVGVVTLCAAAVQPWSSFFPLWSAWFLGDAIGALIVGPAILTMARAAADRSATSWIETGVLVAGTIVVTYGVFGQLFGPRVARHPLEYVIFPFLITAAVRQRQPATALVVLAAAMTAIWNTVRGLGPFGGTEIHQSLALLQIFMGVVAGTGLLLAGAIAERETDERRRAAAHSVSQILATGRSLSDVAPSIVRGICHSLVWSHGAVWGVDRAAGGLSCLAVWPPLGAFDEAARDWRVASGVGLPGRVWATGEPAWIDDLVHEGSLPRAVRREKLSSAFAFPISVGQEVYGVVAFFNRSSVAHDPDLLSTMRSVGHQLGQFVARMQVEAAVEEWQRERERLLERELVARRDAEAANRAKDEFLAILSHELRTPLNAIAGWTRMLLDGTLGESQRARALEVIARNTQVLAQLVADILDVSGIISGGLKLTLGRVDLTAVIRAAVDALGPAAAAKRITLECRMPSSVSPIAGDPQRLQQVVTNLVANALKFTPAGGRVEIELSDSDDEYLRMVVRDNGAGIDPGFLPYVFDRFRQGDPSVSRQHSGLGLGLAIVRHLVELHGGRVSVDSAGPGLGSTFVVDLQRAGTPAGVSQ